MASLPSFLCLLVIAGTGIMTAESQKFNEKENDKCFVVRYSFGREFALLCLPTMKESLSAMSFWYGRTVWVDVGNGLLYIVVPHKASWHAARDWCKRNGGDLATVGMRNYWTRIAIANVMLLRDEFTWIGLDDLKVEKKWRWVDKKAGSGGIFWASGEPNNRGNEDCGGINLGRDFRTNDAPCGSNHYGLCEAKI